MFALIEYFCNYSLGGFTYFKGCSNRDNVGRNIDVACYGNLKSHRISAGEGWKCLQFWYYLGSIGFTSLEVALISNGTKWTAWTSTLHQNNVGVWSYARFPIDSRSNVYEVNKWTIMYVSYMYEPRYCFLGVEYNVVEVKFHIVTISQRT